MPRHSMRRWVPNGKLIRKSGLLLSLFCALIFSLASISQAQDAGDEDGLYSHARIVRISYVQGEVRLDSGRGYESVTMNVPVMEHNRLQTFSDGWAEVQMEDGSIVRLAPDTMIYFTELGRLSSGGTSTTIDLDQGEAELKILKHNGSDFQVTVNNKTIALVNPGFFRLTSTNDDPLELAVWKGDLSVHDGESGENVAVRKNETFVLDPDDPTHYALNQGAEGDELDQWSKDRDSSLNTYAANHSIKSPYQYGASDLDSYGQYTDDPEYGSVWQPNGVGMDWDPYSNGYYTNTGFGPTWVSAYPWGWMPYRYGRWVFISGRGWFWAPGGWNQWNRAPRFVNAPPGFRPPAPPVNTKIAGRPPGQAIRPGEIAGKGVGSRRVFTNDEVQTVPPHRDSATTRPAIVDAGRNEKSFAQTGANGTGEQHGSERVSGGRVSEDRVPPHGMSRSNETPTVSRPVHQSAPPPQSASAEPVHEHTTPAQAPVVHQPSQPVVHQSVPSGGAAPSQHQSASPTSNASSSSDGTRSKNK